MPHHDSFPLQRWLGERCAAIDLLATAHQNIGDAAGPGRPPELGRPLAHAYILRLVAEFQGFARDLHGLAADRLVALTGVAPAHRAELVTAITLDRRLDRGNADLQALRQDFKRIGISELGNQLSTRNQRYWQHDKESLDALIRLRNALAHGNQFDLDQIRARPGNVRDTRSWAQDRLPALNRIAGALDRVVWDHLRQQFAEDPW